MGSVDTGPYSTADLNLHLGAPRPLIGWPGHGPAPPSDYIAREQQPIPPPLDARKPIILTPLYRWEGLGAGSVPLPYQPPTLQSKAAFSLPCPTCTPRQRPSHDSPHLIIPEPVAMDTIRGVSGHVHDGLSRAIGLKENPVVWLCIWSEIHGC